MINWELTKQQFDRSDIRGLKPKVVVSCDKCGATRIITIRCKRKVVNNQMSWECGKCVANRPGKRAKSRAGAKKQWDDPNLRERTINGLKKMWRDPEIANRMNRHKHTEEFKQRMRGINASRVCTQEARDKLARSTKRLWEDSKYREARVASLSERTRKAWENPEYRGKVIEGMKRTWRDADFHKHMENMTRGLWANPEYRAKMEAVQKSDEYKQHCSDGNQKVWDNPEYRKKTLEQRKALWATKDYSEKVLAGALKGRLNCKKVSSITEILYSILDDLGIKYFREYNDRPDDHECLTGGYSWDCVIPREGQKTLLIDCNGDYWHSTKKRQLQDRQKASYVNNNLGGKYEIKYIWEHEFKNHQRVVDLIKYWMGITKIEVVDFDLKDVIIGECPPADYRLLLSKYHYLANAGRGGMAYGAYLGDILIGVVVFSPIIRQNIDTEGLEPGDVRELSRLCIHPKYQKRNFASWLVSRCIKLLPEKYKLIISYCDTTYNHTGAIYKACNFELDRELPPDYWYVNRDADDSVWVMGKKALYRHARKLKMKEAEFAEKYGYIKVYGGKKLRFVFRR